MAGRGPAPASQHQRERDTRRRQEGGQTVVADNRVRGPKAPAGLTPEAVEWYEALRRSPQAQTWLPVDWQHLRMVARLVDRWVLNGYKALDWQEVRLNLSNYGLTPADRLRLKLKITGADDSDTGADAKVASIADRRRRVAERLGSGS